jgi:hypothetical protein
MNVRIGSGIQLIPLSMVSKEPHYLSSLGYNVERMLASTKKTGLYAYNRARASGLLRFIKNMTAVMSLTVAQQHPYNQFFIQKRAEHSDKHMVMPRSGTL